MIIDRFTKTVVLFNCIVPITLLAWDAWHGNLGANPVNFAIRTTGLLALLFLLASLAVTPVSRITGWGWLGQFRRMLGLNAFFHTALHFLLFFAFDRAASVGDTATEIILRPYLMVGTVGLILMVPLAVTSTNGMIKRLGPKRWKALHRLAYAAAAAGALHYYMLVKADVSQPTAFASVLGLLLVYRLGAHYWRLRTDALKYRSGPLPAQPSLPVPVAAMPKTWTGQLRVIQVFDETPEVRTFRLASTSGKGLPFDFFPGQFVSLTLDIDGQKIRRSYTIASAPTRNGYCELTVKREPNGLASRHLHDAVKLGDLLEVRAPAGKFKFTGAEADSVVFVAGGVGITPLMSQIRYLTDVSWPGDIYLVFTVKTERDIIFRDELDALRRRHPNLHVTVTLTRADGAGWSGERGRITPALLSRVVPAIAARRVLICGPTEMTNPTRQMLRDLGVPDKAIQVESFKSPSRATSPETPLPWTNGLTMKVAATNLAEVSKDHTNGAPKPATEAGEDGLATVTFARSGKSAPVHAGQTVLESAEALGVRIQYECRAGICGQCKTKILAGQVVMDSEDALDAVDRANHLILSCQARCVGQVVVEA
jgi:ferredoxin-NADP reductase/DMSO/TMAO reductase YedYZ heme-binding membrane subunit